MFALAAADCEQVGQGVFAQPVNAWSSLAFLVAGAAVAARAPTARARRTELAVFGVAIAANAAGGIAFHGLRWEGSRWLHDLSILAVLLIVAAHGLAVVRSRSGAWTVAVYAASLAASALLLGWLPDSAYALFVLAGGVAGWFELVAYRRERLARPEGPVTPRGLRLGMLGALALAATAFIVGRSAAPLCHPASAFQWHAVWHVMAALALTMCALGIERRSAAVNQDLADA